MTEWGIDTLFNPGKRHMDEEKRRLQSTREEVGDSSGGRRIDLESGTVTISRRPKGSADEDAEDEAAEDQAVDEAAEDQAVDEAAEDRAADGDSEDTDEQPAAEADRSATQK